MRHISLLAVLGSVVSLVFLAACGGSDAAAVPGIQAATAPAGSPSGAALAPDALALVPVDAEIVARISSVDRLDAIAAEIGKAMKQPMPGSLVAQIAMLSGVDPKLIDTTRPALVAARLPKDAPMPLVTFILPVTDDPSKVDAKATRGGYVAVSRDPGYKEGGSKLTDALPAGDYVMRVDLGRLLERYRPMIDKLVRRSGGASTLPGLEKLRDEIVGQAGDLLDSVERFDLALSEHEGRLDLATAVAMRPGSPLARSASIPSGLADLAGRLDRDYPIVALVTLDLGSMAEAVDSLARKWAQGVTEKQRAEGLALVKELDREWLIAAGVEKQLRLVGAFKTRGPAADYMARYLALVHEQQGVKVQVGEAREVHGATVRRLTVTIDVESQAKATGKSAEAVKKNLDHLFGGETFRVDLAARDHDLLIAVGTEVEGLLAEQTMPAGLQRGVDRARGDLRFLLHLDLRALLRGAGEIGMPSVGIAEGEPVLVDIYASTEGNVYRAGASVNLRDIATLR